MNKVIFYSKVTVMLFLAASCSSKNEELTVEYARKKSLLQKTATYLKISRDAVQYYKQKKNEQALQSFKKALTISADSKLYYDYGNLLSNMNRLLEAISAYEIADQLQFPEQKLLYYNIACVYSRMKNGQKTFQYLERAINSGYVFFNYIKNDPDLSWIRSQPSWMDWEKINMQPGGWKQISLNNFGGTYYNIQYINNLRRTRSPISSWDSVRGPIALYLMGNPGSQRFDFNICNNQVLRYSTPKSTWINRGMNLVRIEDEDGTSRIFSVRIRHKEHDFKIVEINMGLPEYTGSDKRAVFLLSDHITTSQFVIGEIFQGAYSDTNGNIMTFNAKGTVTFNRKEYQTDIVIGGGSFPAHEDVISLLKDKSSNPAYIFVYSFQGAYLKLYQAIKNSQIGYDKGALLYSLKRTKE